MNNLTPQDKQVSYRVLRRRLFFANRIADIDADDETLQRALLAIPNIDDIRVLCEHVSPDGIWAARQVLSGEGGL